jgi:hypothetical protein
MARTLFAAFFLAGLLAGCRQDTASTTSLPLPGLDGPVAAVPTGLPEPRIAPPPAAPQNRPRIPGVPEEWVPAVAANSWKWIVIHHSATPAGSAAFFDRAHRQKGWDELGYHFVIGNGTGSRDGQIEVGPRWPKQKWGAHAKTADNQFNDYGIGICLVGNFEIDRPTAAQVRALAKLTAYLMQTYHIPADHVIGHGQAKPTGCPGRNVSIAEIRRLASRLALGEEIDPALGTTASRELLAPVSAGH